LTFHSAQFKQPDGSSTTFAGSDPITGMMFVGTLSAGFTGSIGATGYAFAAGTIVYGQPIRTISGQPANVTYKSDNLVDPDNGNTSLGVFPSGLIFSDPVGAGIRPLNPNGPVEPYIQWWALAPLAANPTSTPWIAVPFTDPVNPVIGALAGQHQYGCYDHNDGFMMFQCKNGLMEGNQVIGVNQQFTSSLGFEFNGYNDAGSLNMIVRNNTAIGNKAGFRILYRGTAGGVTPSSAGTADPSNAITATPASCGFVFYGNSAFGNGAKVGNLWYPADYVQIDPSIGPGVRPIESVGTATNVLNNLSS